MGNTSGPNTEHKHNQMSFLDHLEVLNDEDIIALKGSETMPVALPRVCFSKHNFCIAKNGLYHLC